MGLWHGRGRRQAGSEAFTRPAPRGYAPAVAGLIVGLALAFFALVVVVRSIRIVPQARAGIVERLGRYHRTLDPGLALLVPFADRVRPLIDLREHRLALMKTLVTDIRREVQIAHVESGVRGIVADAVPARPCRTDASRCARHAA